MTGHIRNCGWKRNKPMLASAIQAVLLLALLAAAASADTQVFSGYLYSGETLTVDRQVITAYISSSENGLVADYSTGIISVINNTCQSTDYFKLCLDNIEQDYTAKKKKMSIRAFSTIPSLTITRKASKTELAIGEETAFTVTIDNTGGVARNATYTDAFPENIEIRDIDGASAKGNAVTWSGTIPRSGSKEISYTIRPKDELKQGLKASLRYFDGYSMQTIYSDETTLSVTQFLKIEATIGKEDIYLGQPNNFTLNLTNRGNNTINATVDIDFGEGLEVLAPSAFTKTGSSTYTWNGELRKRNQSNSRVFSRAYIFELKGAKIGSTDITATARYTDLATGENVKLADIKKTVKVSDRGTAIRTSFSDQTLEARQKHTLKIWMQNLNAYANITDVLITTYTPLEALPDYYAANMGSGEQLLVIERDIYMPGVESTTGYPLDVNATYTIGDKRATKTHRGTISVMPVQELAITHALSKASVESGEDFFITATVKNPRKTGLNRVKVHDIIPEGFTSYGSSSATMSIAKESTANAYTYRLTAPRASKETSYTITTIAEYSDADNQYDYSEYKSYSNSKNATITVLAPKFTLDIARTLKETEIYKGNTYDVNYVIKNPDEKQAAKGITITAGLQQDFDAVGNESYELPDIGPGETVYFTSKEKVRAKFNGTYTIAKSLLRFRNQYEDAFEQNATEIQLTVKDSHISGPAISLAKNSSDRTNNTEPLLVTLTIRNTGDTPAEAEITDSSQSFTAYVQPKSETSYNYTTILSLPGIVDLLPAAATYRHQGKTYITGSNAKTVEVLNKPLVKIEKEAPEKANNIDSYTVRIKLTSSHTLPLNLIVTDGAKQWELDSFTGEKELSYEEKEAQTGTKTLGAATAEYQYMNRTYHETSSQPQIHVEEKSFAKLTKAASKKAAKPGEEVTITITAKNEQEKTLSMTIRDKGKEWAKAWTAELGPGEEKKITYKAKADESLLEKASASFKYEGKNYTISSEPPALEILTKGKKTEKQENTTANETGKKQEEEPQPKEQGIFKRIINAIIKILTWKRSEE
ncbi:DUF11 domain-containing protein [Candidatus Woesearchaeota archaeon]|nr:DUF11 domain-containing protein [Candidatus Woesearchaeota archaeon]